MLLVRRLPPTNYIEYRYKCRSYPVLKIATGLKWNARLWVLVRGNAISTTSIPTTWESSYNGRHRREIELSPEPLYMKNFLSPSAPLARHSCAFFSTTSNGGHRYPRDVFDDSEEDQARRKAAPSRTREIWKPTPHVNPIYTMETKFPKKAVPKKENDCKAGEMEKRSTGKVAKSYTNQMPGLQNREPLRTLISTSPASCKHGARTKHEQTPSSTTSSRAEPQPLLVIYKTPLASITELADYSARREMLVKEKGKREAELRDQLRQARSEEDLEDRIEPIRQLRNLGEIATVNYQEYQDRLEDDEIDYEGWYEEFRKRFQSIPPGYRRLQEEILRHSELFNPFDVIYMILELDRLVLELRSLSHQYRLYKRLGYELNYHQFQDPYSLAVSKEQVRKEFIIAPIDECQRLYSSLDLEMRSFVAARTLGGKLDTSRLESGKKFLKAGYFEMRSTAESLDKECHDRRDVCQKLWHPIHISHKRLLYTWNELLRIPNLKQQLKKHRPTMFAQMETKINELNNGYTYMTSLRRYYFAYCLRTAQIRKLPLSDQGTKKSLVLKSSPSIDQNCFPALMNPRYTIPEPILADLMLKSLGTTAAYWSFRLYENERRRKPNLRYCSSKETADAVAGELLEKRLVGFDMEWSPSARSSNRIKDNVSLVQIACEDFIGLFHVARFEGDNAKDLMPPNLKLLLQSERIMKSGVAIEADYMRLKDWFGITPGGLLELNHLHTLIEYSSRTSEDILNINQKFISLGYLVKRYLQLPLEKNLARTSDWSKPIPLDSGQLEYAANDAYAGLQLLLKLDDRRRAIEPVPPPPHFAELELPIRLANKRTVDEFRTELEIDIARRNEERGKKEERGLTGRARLSSFNLTFTRSEGDQLILQATQDMRKCRNQLGAATIRVRFRPVFVTAYFLWHKYCQDLEGVACLMGFKPTIISIYIVEAIQMCHLPYDKARLTNLVAKLPGAVVKKKYNWCADLLL